MFYHGTRRYYTSQNMIRYIILFWKNKRQNNAEYDILYYVILKMLYSIMLVYINLIISISYSMSCQPLLYHTIVSVYCTILLCLY